jgi:hypothetical protein
MLSLWLATAPQAGEDAEHYEGSARLMMSNPRSVDRLLGYMSRAVWLIMAYSFGTMVGRLILYWQ